MVNEQNDENAVASAGILESMTPDERYYAHHFMSACDEHVGFIVPRETRYRLRELGLMRWVGGRRFEVTDKLRDMESELNGMYPDFGRDANKGSYLYPLFEHMQREHGLTLTESELREICRIAENTLVAVCEAYHSDPWHDKDQATNATRAARNTQE